MFVWRNLGSLVILLVAAAYAPAQTYSLTETPQAGDCLQYHLEMSLAGELKIMKDDAPASIKLSATATHDFPERLLVVSKAGVPQKTARFYGTAKAVIAAGSDRTERTLRPERSLVIVQRPVDQTLVYSPVGALTREEMELTGEHFDTLALAGLLPGKAVAISDTWKLSMETVQNLCHCEGLTAQDLICTLESVKDNLAQVTIKGTVTGIDLGALVKMTITAAYHFDLTGNRLVHVEWKQKDDRSQGPASPASVMETSYVVKRSAVAQPETLTDVALISVPDNFEPPMIMTQLSYQDTKSRFSLLYGREWQLVSRTDDHLVMRLLDKGDFVAQVTVTPWSKAAPGDHIKPEEFQKAMAQTPGWQQTEVLQVGEVPTTETGRWVYRVSAVGEMDGLKLLQNFYIVAGPTGDQIVLAFTMNQGQADKLGSRDLALVGNLELAAPAKGKN